MEYVSLDSPLLASFSIGGLVFFLFHAGFEATALNHEAVDDPMENGVVVKTGADIRQEVVDGFRCVGRVQFNLDRAEIGMQCDGHIFPLIG